MKKIGYTLALFTAVVFSLATTACSDDEALKKPAGGDRLTFGLSADRAQVRAVVDEPGEDALNENKIARLDIFFYEGNTLGWHASGAGISYDVSSQEVTIQVPPDKLGMFDGSVNYDIYVVANNSADLTPIAEGAANLNALQNLVFRTAAFETDGGSAAQASFVMDGVLPGIAANLASPNLGNINLKRAAAKVRLALLQVDVEGYTYTPGTAQARLVHFTDQSVLTNGGTPFNPSSGGWKETGYRTLSGSPGNETAAAPFYAYANDWSSDADRETYLELRIPLVDDNTSETEQHHYRIPLTPQDPAGEDAAHMDKLQRNFFYDIKVAVKMPGGIGGDPVGIDANYLIKDWTTKEILVNINASHYLVVSEQKVVMPNIADYTLTFNSSIPDVTLVSGSLKASYTYVRHTNGQLVTENVSPAQRPSVTVQPGVAEGTITIRSAIPVNYIPKDIEFKITNGPLTETVTIRQLPATYFTAERGKRSFLRPDGKWKENDPKEKNRYMYAVTTLAPAGDIVWGFPPVDGDGCTVNSNEVANMVSPRFMMASQLGATERMGYERAKTNCKDYWEETVINGQTKRYDDWRLPTEAEIRYLDYLQHDNNPIGIVMAGEYYWDAYEANGAYRMSGGSGGSSSFAFTRCIRDIKD